jgi:hypothetical protein
MSNARGNGPGIPVIEPTTPDPEQSALTSIGVCVAVGTGVLVEVGVAVFVFVGVCVAVAQPLGLLMPGIVSSEYDGIMWSYAGSELGLLVDDPSNTLMLPLVETGNVEPESENSVNVFVTGWSTTVKPAGGAGCEFSVSK